MRVLVACEFSGVVRDAFLCAGHDAWSCDLLPTERTGPHFQRDVRDVLGLGWDLLIAHPPCTYLANSGVRWLHSDPTRWPKLIEAAAFYRELLDAPIPRRAIENPIMHKYAVMIVGERATQIVQPHWFGHGEVKATGLHLRNLPKLVPTWRVEGRVPRVHYESPGADRWKRRSVTYEGLAQAMADQWGNADVLERAA